MKVPPDARKDHIHSKAQRRADAEGGTRHRDSVDDVSQHAANDVTHERIEGGPEVCVRVTKDILYGKSPVYMAQEAYLQGKRGLIICWHTSASWACPNGTLQIQGAARPRCSSPTRARPSGRAS